MNPNYINKLRNVMKGDSKAGKEQETHLLYFLSLE